MYTVFNTKYSALKALFTDEKLAFIFTKLWDKSPEEVVKFLESKKIKVSWNWQEQAELIKKNMFTVAKTMNADVVQDIQNGLVKSLAKGETYKQFKDNLTPFLEKRGYLKREDGSAWRLDTIYRTNLQSGYMSGRLKNQLELGASFPIWQYIAIEDKRTTKICSKLDDKVFRYDDPLAKSYYPPNHYNCRSRVKSLTEGQAKRKGLKPKKLSPDDLKDVGEGFESPPTAPFSPDLKKYNPKLRKELKKDVDKNVKELDLIQKDLTPDKTGTIEDLINNPVSRDEYINKKSDYEFASRKAYGVNSEEFYKKEIKPDIIRYKEALDDDTQNAIQKFTGVDYVEINQALRKKDFKSKYGKIGKLVSDDDLDFEFNNAPVLFRGEKYLESSDLNRLFNLKKGDDFDFNGQLVSSSQDLFIGSNFSKLDISGYNSVLYKIDMPKKYKAGGGLENEKEIILKPDSVFEVKDITVFKNDEDKIKILIDLKYKI